MSVAARSSRDHARRPTSSHAVPAASDISEVNEPINHDRRKSFGNNTLRTLREISGSNEFTHAILGAVKPGKTMFPVSFRNKGLASRAAASACARVSFHKMQGRKTAPD